MQKVRPVMLLRIWHLNMMRYKVIYFQMILSSDPMRLGLFGQIQKSCIQQFFAILT